MSAILDPVVINPEPWVPDWNVKSPWFNYGIVNSFLRPSPDDQHWVGAGVNSALYSCPGGGSLVDTDCPFPDFGPVKSPPHSALKPAKVFPVKWHEAAVRVSTRGCEFIDLPVEAQRHLLANLELNIETDWYAPLIAAQSSLGGPFPVIEAFARVVGNIAAAFGPGRGVIYISSATAIELVRWRLLLLDEVNGRYYDRVAGNLIVITRIQPEIQDKIYGTNNDASFLFLSDPIKLSPTLDEQANFNNKTERWEIGYVAAPVFCGVASADVCLGDC